jgi:hypothetical protein
VLARLCEEFPGRLPSEIWAEWRRLPEGFLFDLIEMRHFAKALQMYEDADTAAKQKALPAWDLIDLAKALDFEDRQGDGG